MKLDYGLIGEKLTHSASPFIHEEIYKLVYNKNVEYGLLEIKKTDIHSTLKRCQEERVKGLNVTIPYKSDAMEYMDEISREAKKIGAINTIQFKNGIRQGYNTDYYGFGMMCDSNYVHFNNKKVAILGTGGAAKAVFHYVKDNGGDITVVTRKHKSDQKLIYGKQVITYDQLEKDSEFDIIINTTPVGMYPNVGVSPISEKIVENSKVIIDLIYNPLETELLRYAIKHNKQAIDGLYMLVAQAIKAQEIWNDIKIDDSVTKEIYSKLRIKLKEGE